MRKFTEDMKTTLLILTIGVLVTSVLPSDEVYCRQLDAFAVCGSPNVLTFVNQTRDAQTLRLNVNRFSSIAPNAFQNLHVEKLLLLFPNAPDEPKIMNFSQDAFKGLSRVNWLHVEYLTFPLKPNPFQDLQLTFLSIYGCWLTQVPEFIADFPQLSVLWLINNNITSVTSSSFVGASENIGEISLEENKISSVEPKSFSRFKNLKELSLAYNELTDIAPGALDGLEQLEHLKLSRNKITAVRRNTFSGLTQLKTLDLESNQISEIEPQAFAGLNIQNLTLLSNKLENLQLGAFDGLAELRNLNLRYNKLHTASNAFNGLTKLKELDLNWNQIDQIEPHAFSGLVLTTLRLRHNRLTVLEPGAFGGLNVNTLDLSENEINQIKSQALANLTVEKILLYASKIHSVDRDSWGLNESARVIMIN